MLLGILGASLLGNMLADKEIVRAGYGFKGKGIIRVGNGSRDFQFLKKILIPQHAFHQTLKYKSIILYNIDLMEFFL